MAKRSKKKENNTGKQKERQRQEAMVIAYYKRNLPLMIERELDVKLSKWQTFLLKLVQKGIKNGKEKE